MFADTNPLRFFLCYSGSASDWRVLQKDHSDFCRLVECVPCLCIEVPLDAASETKANSMLSKSICELRLKATATVYVIRPSPTQLYLCEQLDKSPHYQLFDQDVSRLKKLCYSLNRRIRRSNPIKVIDVEANADYQDGYLKVLNSVPPSSFDFLHHSQLIERLSGLQLETNRGHRRVDLGTIGYRDSAGANEETLGIPKPAAHKPTRDLYWKSLMLLLWRLVASSFPEELDQLCNDQDRNSHFAWQHTNHKDSRAEAVSVISQCFVLNGVPRRTEILRCHIDRQNDHLCSQYRKVVGSVQLVYDRITNTLVRNCQATFA